MTKNSTRPTGQLLGRDLIGRDLIGRVRRIFAPRDLIFHDGRAMHRIRLGSATQASVAAVATGIVGFAAYGLVGLAGSAAMASGLVAPSSTEARLASLNGQVTELQAKVATIRHAATLHAQRMEQRQALLDAALTGKPGEDGLRLATLTIDPTADKLAASTIAPMLRVEGRQTALAATAQRALEQRYALTASRVSKLGIAPNRIAQTTRVAGGMGGPLIAANSAEARADLSADAQFRSLFMTWKKLDKLEQGVIAIPSVQPVANLKFTSNFGIRSDPFRGTAAMHAGVDIPGPLGTPVYATADGMVGRAERAGGYGNLVELEHGKGIATRYGHLSKILVTPGAHVKRGQLIALMGSTGRSTGSHLHYEVRIDGHAVNPAPFLTTADYLLAAQDRAVHEIPISTGPAPQD